MSLTYTGSIGSTFYEVHGWTAADDVRLFDMVAEGLSSAEIGRRMGRTKCSIIGRIRRRGLTLAREPSGGILRLSKGKPGKPRSGGGARAVKTATVRSTPPPARVPSVVDPDVPESLPPAAPTPLPGEQRSAALSRPAPGPARLCQFPLTSGRPWRFCEAPTVDNTSWCARHRAIVWVRPPRWTT